MEILIAGCLVVLTALVHAAGFSALIRILIRSRILTKSGFPLATALVIGVTCWLILLHSAEICLWGFFYWWRGSFPDANPRFIFPASLTRRWVTATSSCPSRRGCSPRSKP